MSSYFTVSSSTTSLNRVEKLEGYKLKWPTISADIIYERFWSKGLTFWMLYIGGLQLFTLAISGVIPPFDLQGSVGGSIGSMLSSSVTFMYYVVYGLMVVVALIPFMNCNGKNAKDSIIKKVGLAVFPVLFGLGQFFLWQYVLNVNDQGSNLLIICIFISLGAYIFFYVWSLFRNKSYSYFDLKISKDIKHVRQLLQLNICDTHKSNDMFRYSMTQSHVKKSERSIGSFLSQTKIKDLFEDLYHNTPGLLVLSCFLGITATLYEIFAIMGAFYITLTYEDFQTVFYIELFGIFVVTVNDLVNEEAFNLIKNSWNTSMALALGLSGTLAFVSLIWPMIFAVNARYNLRTGLWRHNKHAYLKSYSVHAIVNIPGNQIGTVILGVLIYTFVLQIFLFTLVYPPICQVLWIDMFSQLLITICIGIALKTAIMYFIFGICLKCTNNPNYYSIATTVMCFVNFLYGTINSFLRLCFFMGYSFVALFRFDVSVLPPITWPYLDNAFYAFNAFLMYQVCCNPH